MSPVFVWAARTLGGSFTAYPRPRQEGVLVEDGPYRFVRHPVYGAGVLVLLGYGLVTSVVATAAVPAIAVLWWLEVERRGTASGCALPGVRRLQAPGAAPDPLVRRAYSGGVSAAWPEPVERVAAYLREAGAEARLEELESATATAEDAARAAGSPLAQIVKSIVVVCDERPVMALVPGDRRADLDKIARAANAAAARIATAAEVRDSTGFAPGAVAPFPLPNVELVLIDQGLLAHDTVWIGAGSPSHLAALSPGDLVRLARARPIDAVQEAEHSPAGGRAALVRCALRCARPARSG